MELLVVCLVAFLTAILTFFSGFGQGTIMMPVFAAFFPVELAVALTGFVHFFSNVVRLALVARHTNMAVLLRFGMPAVLAAFAGAWVLVRVAGIAPLHTYHLGGHLCTITPVRLVIAALLFFFALADLLPFFGSITFGSRWLPVGGLLSGFFGGLSGNQGALRSAFLVRAGLSKEVYIGTSVAIACCIDITRLSVYASRFAGAGLQQHPLLLVCATTAAIAGTLAGRRLLRKVTITFVQRLVAVMLFAIALALGAGIL